MRKYPVRRSVRILLLNNNDELLLMCIDDPKTKSIGEKIGKPFWVSIGGAIEESETVFEAAVRELYEETGLTKKDIDFGPVVWRREIDIILYGKPSHIKEKYVVVRSKNTNVSVTKLTAEETNIIKHLRWFSLDQIAKSSDTFYPELLLKYLPDIIAGKFPKEPIDVTKK